MKHYVSMKEPAPPPPVHPSTSYTIPERKLAGCETMRRNVPPPYPDPRPVQDSHYTEMDDILKVLLVGAVLALVLGVTFVFFPHVLIWVLIAVFIIPIIILLVHLSLGAMAEIIDYVMDKLRFKPKMGICPQCGWATRYVSFMKLYRCDGCNMYITSPGHGGHYQQPPPQPPNRPQPPPQF